MRKPARYPSEPEYDDLGRRLRLIHPRELKVALCGNQNWRCCYCGCSVDMNGRSPTEATFEHVVPFGHGGDDDESNLVIACRRCNYERSRTTNP